MTLIVEDGTGLSTAESYISVVDADAYIALYKGVDTVWDAATVTAKEIAARNATQWIDGYYSWKGYPVNDTQALDHARDGVYGDGGYLLAWAEYSVKLKQAEAEVMYLIVTGVTITETVTRASQLKRKKVDVLEKEWEVGASYQPAFPVINRLVSDLTLSSTKVALG